MVNGVGKNDVKKIVTPKYKIDFVDGYIFFFERVEGNISKSQFKCDC